MRKGNREAWLIKILLVLCILLIIGTLGCIAYYGSGYVSERQVYDGIREQVKREAASETAAASEADASDQDAAGVEASIDMEALRAINPDAVGWLTACGGEIDGPVVQAEDDQYYLHHLFTGEEGRAGTFFADTRSAPAFKTPCTAIFGHNRKDGSMFHPLLQYKDPEYGKRYPSFSIYTDEGEKECRLIAAFFAEYGSIPGIGDQDRDIASLEQRAKQLSLYDTGATGEWEGIVILCTCEYSGDNYRMVIYGAY